MTSEVREQIGSEYNGSCEPAWALSEPGPCREYNEIFFLRNTSCICPWISDRLFCWESAINFFQKKKPDVPSGLIGGQLMRFDFHLSTGKCVPIIRQRRWSLSKFSANIWCPRNHFPVFWYEGNKDTTNSVGLQSH